MATTSIRPYDPTKPVTPILPVQNITQAPVQKPLLPANTSVNKDQLAAFQAANVARIAGSKTPAVAGPQVGGGIPTPNKSASATLAPDGTYTVTPPAPTTPTPGTGTSALDAAQQKLDEINKQAEADRNAQIKVEQDLQATGQNQFTQTQSDLANEATSFNATQKASLEGRKAAINAQFDKDLQDLQSAQHKAQELLLDRIGQAGGGNVGTNAQGLTSDLLKEQISQVAKLQAARTQELNAADSEANGANQSFTESQRAKLFQAQNDLNTQKEKILDNIRNLRGQINDQNKEVVLQRIKDLTAKATEKQKQIDSLAKDSQNDLQKRRAEAIKLIQDRAKTIAGYGIQLGPQSSDAINKIGTSDNPEQLAQNYLRASTTNPDVTAVEKAITGKKTKTGGSGGGGGNGPSSGSPLVDSLANDLFSGNTTEKEINSIYGAPTARAVRAAFETLKTQKLEQSKNPMFAPTALSFALGSPSGTFDPMSMFQPQQPKGKSGYSQDIASQLGEALKQDPEYTQGKAVQVLLANGQNPKDYASLLSRLKK